jgi:hypothetical protein
MIDCLWQSRVGYLPPFFVFVVSDEVTTAFVTFSPMVQQYQELFHRHLLSGASCLYVSHVAWQFYKHLVRGVVLGTYANRQTDFAIQ